MSAFMCDGRHISALACYAVDNRLWSSDTVSPDCPDTEQEKLGLLLHAENERSLRHRYQDWGDVDAFEFAFVQTIAVPPIQVLKAAHCYIYQACEHPEWKGCAVADILDAITHHAMRRLSGYEQADWGWPESHPEPISLARLARG